MATPRYRSVLLATLAAGSLAHPARAETDRAITEPIPVGVVEMLQGLLQPTLGKSLSTHHLNRLGLSDEYGLIYTYPLARGDNGPELRFRGPVLGRETAVGLSLEIRF